jgi:L-threonylcarbamoyladenylate synthase
MAAKVLEPTIENIAFLGERLRAGEVVAMPTETVYGLAANVWDESALAKVFSVKERPRFDPLICHVAQGCLGSTNGSPHSAASALAKLIDMGLLNEEPLREGNYADAERLAQQFWPGPLTLVLPKSSRVSDLATSGLATLGVRAPRHPVAQALIAAAGVPLCAPSANRFGRISPTSAQDVCDELGDRIDWILDGGTCEIGLESTVVGFDEHGPRILRRGGVSKEELESTIGKAVHYAPLTTIGSGQLASPGMLASHYAPRKKLFLLPKPLHAMSAAELEAIVPAGARIGLLCFGDEDAQFGNLSHGSRVELTSVLSPAGDIAEAARNLFRELRRLDVDERTTHLVAEPPPNTEGLGAAILDRLQRAAS